MNRTPFIAKDTQPGGAKGQRNGKSSKRGLTTRTNTASESGNQQARTDDIAVVAMAGRFPRANSVDALWQNLVDGVDSVTEMPSDRWDVSALYASEPGPGQSNSKWGGFVGNIKDFDPHAFGLSAKEALHMDPQQRLFLMEALKALEEAGYAGPALDGQSVGLYVGTAESGYAGLLKDAGKLYTPQAFLGNAASILAARVSYMLNLRGPAIAVETACSSSLVAIHLGCEGLRRGEIDMALAGGAYLLVTPQLYQLATSAGMLSATGRCHAFGAAADGFVPGEAVAVVVLKRLEDAVADGDQILSVIAGSGINQDGRSNGMTAPNAHSQSDLIRDVMARYDIDENSVGYVETHGTGTKLGDPIELEGLNEAYRNRSVGAPPCYLGSVKSNIGHTQLSAGIAGFIKLVQSLRHGHIPKSLHADPVNPLLPLDERKFRVASEATDWPAPENGAMRHGAVSAFGFSGSNAHVVVREYLQPTYTAHTMGTTLLLLSGRDQADLEEKSLSLAITLEECPTLDLTDVAFTLMTGRPAHNVRRAIVATDTADAIKQLRSAPTQLSRRKVLDDEQIGSVLALMPTQPTDIRASFPIALAMLAKAFEQGCTTDERWLRIFVNRDVRRVKLPTTLYRTEDYWVGPQIAAQANNTISFRASDDLAFQHMVSGKPIYPGTALLGAFMAASDSTCLRNVSFKTPLVAQANSAATLTLKASDDEARLCGEDGTVFLKANATLEPAASANNTPALGEAKTVIPAEVFYKRFSDAGLEYGPALRGVSNIKRAGELVEARISVQQVTHNRPGGKIVSAEMLDMAFQCVAAFTNMDTPLPLMIPVSLNQLTVLKPLPDSGRVIVRRTSGTQNGTSISVDIWVMDDSGTLCVYADGLNFTQFGSKIEGSGLLVLRPSWHAIATPIAADMTGVTVLKGSEGPGEVTALLQGGARNFVQIHSPGNACGSAMRGFWMSVAKEYSDLRVAFVETDLADSAAQAFGLTVAGSPVILRALSDNWFARRLEAAEKAPTDPAQLTADDVILVTGGTGGIGQLVCRHMESRGAGRVIAVSRSANTGAQNGAITEWACDLTDSDAVARMVSDVEKQFGTITGIIHAAGVTGDHLIATMDVEQARERALHDVKIKGADNLAACTADTDLRFFILFGGLVSEVGNRGQALYGYANAYLSNFAEMGRNRHCVCWPLWADGGMEMPDHVREHLEISTGLTPMPAKEGLSVLDHAIACAQTQSIVLYGDIDRLQGALTQEPEQPEDAANTRSPELRQALVKPVLELLANSVSMQATDIDETMATADIDLDSLTVMSLKDDLLQTFGVTIAPSAFFEFRTIGTMIDRIADLGGPALGERLGIVARREPQLPIPKPAPKHVVPALAAKAQAAAPQQPIQLPDSRQEDIAIVGMDCRFPKADGADAFWQNLLSGVDGISQLPAERAAEWLALPESVRDQAAMGWGGFLTDIDQFDAAFFGISPAEAKLMDPQQRLLLQSVWRALEAAGYGPRSLGGSRTGVFVGCAGYDYANVIRQAGAAIEAFTPTGISPSLLANRLSHVFDFTGPSETLDTACASSLVALDHAVEAIRRGACDGAVVAAANLILLPDLHQAFCRAGLLSATGACRAFDASADGYVRSEGVAALYLKPLSHAQADGDRILGRILATAVNHGGKATSLTAPSPSQQAAVITQAWQSAGLEPDQIDYIEAHGTGTKLGDPVEIAGLKMALSDPCWTRHRGKQAPLIVGAVKSAIGHTEAVSGLAGVIKALQVVSTGIVPGNLHLEGLNPDIDTADTPLEIASSQRALKGQHLIAGISSFGFGGTNAHVVLAGERAFGTADYHTDTRPQLIPLSARSPEDLRRRVQDLHAWLVEQTTNAAPLSDTPTPDTAEFVGHITAQLSGILNIPETNIDPDEAFAELGLDFLELRLLMHGLSQSYPGMLSRDLVTVENTVRDIASALGATHNLTDETAHKMAPVNMADIAFTLQTGRDPMACRHACVCASPQELSTALAAFLKEQGELSDKPPSVPASVRRLLEGVGGHGLIRAMAEEGDLTSLAEIWRDGVDIPWKALWTDKPSPRKIELPTYRFEGTRFWVDSSGNTPVAAPQSSARTTFLRPVWRSLSGGKGMQLSVTDFAPGKPLAALLTEITPKLEAGEARLYRTPDLASGMAVAALLRTAAAEYARDCGNVLVSNSKEPALDIPAIKPGSVMRDHGTGYEILGLAPTELQPGDVPDSKHTVILGGAGGLGLALAKHLARRENAKLLLVGRRPEGEAINEALTALKAMGAQATYRALDITNQQAVTTLLQDTENQWGGIDLIAHCAGVQDDRLLTSVDSAAMKRVLDAKVDGIKALRAAVGDLNERPCVVSFSSLAGWMGNPGQAIYAAASAYEDGVALNEDRWQSIAWPLWDGIGMAPPAVELDRLAQKTGLKALPETIGLEAFDRIRASDEQVLGVAYGPADAPLLRQLTEAPQAGQLADKDATALILEALEGDTPPDDHDRLDEIGFNSLIAARLSQLIGDHTGKDIAIARLVECATIGQLCTLIDGLLDTRPTNKPDEPPAGAGPEAPLPASQQQVPIWRHYRLAPDSFAYNMPVVIRLAGQVDVAQLEAAIDTLVARHESLHCRFEEDQRGNLLRLPVKARPALKSWSLPEGLSQDDTIKLLRNRVRTPFDLKAEAPCRFDFIPDWDGEPHLMCVFHHIAMDGISLRILMTELEHLIGRQTLPPVGATYGQFVSEEQAYRQSEAAEKDRAFWANNLSRDVRPLDLPSSRTKKPTVVYDDTATHVRALTPALRKGLLANIKPGQLFSTTATAWAWTLAPYVEDRFVGLMVPFAGRHASKLQDTVGCLMNPVILQADLSQHQNFREALTFLDDKYKQSLGHSRLALADVLSAVGDEGTPAKAVEKAQAAFYFQSWLGAASRTAGEVQLERLDVLHHEGEYPITLEVIDDGTQFTLKLKVDNGYCDKQTAELLLARYEAVLTSITTGNDPDLIPLTEQDRKVCEGWQQDQLEPVPDQPVHRAILDRARATPSTAAVLAGEQEQTYGELHEQIAGIASGLLKTGVKPGDTVAVALERNISLPATLLAVMSVGAAYLPVDPAFPQDRNHFYLKDSGAKYIICAHEEDGVEATQLLLPHLLKTDPVPDWDKAKTNASDPAYIIYTSGSTGKPKGVVVSHGALSNFISSMVKVSGLDATDRLLAVTTVAFDISGLELFLPLWQGASVVISTGFESKDPYKLWEMVATHKVTTLQATPSSWRLLIRAHKTGHGLKRILVGGEALPADLARALRCVADDVINVYGPTETTIWSTAARVDPSERVHIGKAIDNTLLRVVNKDRKDCAIGTAGELWIGGHGVASGYWQRQELTADRFVETGDGQTFYRTGDLVRFLSDGNLQHLGRLDGQVKLNGFRIEVGEIEVQIIEKLGFDDCAVILAGTEDDAEHLVAFVTGSAKPRHASSGWDACNTVLRSTLPAYMIPTNWVQLDTLPHTNNNKVDRQALVSLYSDRPPGQSNDPVTKPATKGQISDSLTEIVAQVAGIPADALDANEPLSLQGFDSLAIIKLTEKLNEAHGLQLSPVDLYNAPTLVEINTLVSSVSTATPTVGAGAKPGGAHDGAIAIIGMSGQMPGAEDLDTFWENLNASRTSISGVPEGRWTDENAALGYKAGFLKGIDLFDAPHFGMTAQEAASTDPQQRLFTLNCYRAIEDAGIAPESLKGRKVGVYAGAALGDYQRLLEQADGFNAFSMIGMSPSIIPARIAFHLDLKGPTETVDTACSSALVSVHNAVKALRAGDIEMALAGGVYLMTTPLGQMISDQAGIIANDGRCKPFDERANGIVIGEAVGVLTLKRLEEAMRDGDPIRAVIRGAAVNQDGRTNGITAPSSGAQATLIGTATDVEGLSVDDISYVECHGTGTKLGDPIEIEGLRRASLGSKTPCWLGSVKANVGHCYQAAGIVGLIKAVLSLEHQKLPGQPDFGVENPLLKLEGSGLNVLKETQAWDVANGRKRVAGVSAFGFSGTNAHVVVEEWPTATKTPRPTNRRPFNLASYWPHITKTSAPLIKAPSPEGDCEKARSLILGELSALSGVPASDIRGDASLEADIGMDSIKLMGLIAKLCRLLDLPKIDAAGMARITTVESLLALVPSGQSAETDAFSRAYALIMGEFEALSGVPATDISRDANLEADIGMDSIKLMGLVARLNRIAGAESLDASSIAKIVTVGDLLDAISLTPESRTVSKTRAEASSTPIEPREPEHIGGRILVDIPYAGYLFLLGHHLIRSSSLCSWLRLEGPLDIAVLQQAWQHVVDQQPSCRLIFERQQKTDTFADYQAVVLENPKVQAISVTDLSSLTPARQDAALQQVFDDALNAEWSLESWPLHRFDVYRVGPNEHALFLINEHCVSDGIGNQRLLAALMQSYQKLVEFGPESLGKPPKTGDADFARLMARFNDAADNLSEPVRMAEDEGPYFWNPSGKAIEDFQPDFTVSVTTKSRAETADLMATASNLGMSLNQMLVLAMARASHSTSGDDQVSVQMPTSGRSINGLDAHDLVCCLAQNLPLDFGTDLLSAEWNLAGPLFARRLAQILAAESDWHVTKAMADTIASDIPLDPEALRGDLRPLFRGRLRSNIYVPYIGDTGIKAAYVDVSVTAYRAGTVNGPATVDILHEIFDRQLHSSWNFDRGFFAPEEIARLRDAFEQELAAAVAAAPNQEAPKETYADTAPLPHALVNAAEAVLGRQLEDNDACAAIDRELGLDSLQRIRILSKLPAAYRQNTSSRAALLTASTLAEMAGLMLAEGPVSVTENHDNKPEDANDDNLDAASFDYDELPIHRIIKQMAARPDAVAVTSANGQLTYAELDDKSHRGASYLIQKDCEQGARIGVLMDRGCDFIASVLAVLRAGMVYVPLDPDLPKDRLSYIADHAKLALVLCKPEHEGLLLVGEAGDANRPPIVPVSNAFAVPPMTATDLPIAAPEDTMLVLYTSGSTGRPKGVELNHAGYANRLAWQQKQFELKPGEGVLHKTTICFDVSVWEIFWPLMCGSILHTVGPNIARDPWALAQVMRDKKIAVLHFVPSMFGEFLSVLEADTPHEPFTHLRWVVLSGEAFPVAQARKWFELFGKSTRLANLYGPTEASIDVTCQVVPDTPPAGWARIPIGPATDNVELTILDKDLKPVHNGAEGELFIGGVQLAVGYLHAKDLTDQAFKMIDPDGNGTRRFYKTGDLVRRLPGGAYDHLGRLDSQVKLRGYRIELGEIEAVLCDHADVKQVAVMVEDGALVAHIAGSAQEPQSYLSLCAQKLPSYMVPHKIALHKELPINANGKLDRRAIQASESVINPLENGALLPAQSWMLQHFPAPYHWWGTSRFTVNRALDMDRVKDTFAALAARHDALRTVYEQDDDGRWHRQVVAAADAGAPDLRVLDARSLPDADREEWIAKTMYDCCMAYSIDRLPLDAAVILQEGAERYTFCLANHHVNGDFVSGTILFQDFWTLYEGQELAPPAQQQGDIVALLDKIDLTADQAYWQRLSGWQPSPVSYLIDPATANLEQMEVATERCLTIAETKALSTKARAASGTALYPLLAAAFYMAVAEQSDRPDIAISHRMMGRILGNDLPDFTDTVGNFAVHFPLVVKAGETLATTATKVADALANVPHGGVTYDWLAAQAKGKPSFPYPDEQVTALRLNYLGQTLPHSDNGFEFNASQLNQRFAPDSLPRSAEVEVHLSVERGCLKIRASFVEGRHDKTLINELLDHVKRLLSDL